MLLLELKIVNSRAWLVVFCGIPKLNPPVHLKTAFVGCLGKCAQVNVDNLLSLVDLAESKIDWHPINYQIGVIIPCYFLDIVKIYVCL